MKYTYCFNGHYLRRKAQSHKMTQGELAEKIGCTKKDISRWENGERTPNMENLFKLAQALKCNRVDDLIMCLDEHGRRVYLD